MRDAPSADTSISDWPTRQEWLLIIGAWTTVALLTAVNDVLAPRGGGPVEWGQFPVELGREIFEYGFWIVLTPCVFWLARRLPVERGDIARNVVLHLVFAVLGAFAVESADSILRGAMFGHGRGGAFFDPVRIATRLWFVNELVVYFVILAAGFARDYHLQKKERQAETERLRERTAVLEKELTEARLQTLRMQINPHFLFNTLHAVSTLVGRDPQGVRRMITRLSELLRRVLDEDAPQEVPLSDEIDILEDYLEIQQIRFQGGLDVEIDVPEEHRLVLVPYLLLQPLAENAVKHGAARVRGTGRIWIRATREEDTLVVTVRDNGPGFHGDDISSGLGLKNVRARLEGLYGDAAALHVASNEASSDDEAPGVTATLRLPYHTSADLYVVGEESTDRSDVATARSNAGASEDDRTRDTDAGTMHAASLEPATPDE
ncbi:ATPase [Longibacter salinarum]|uniref:ATPase n=1 Tax=Longibacter salinarum TaxID=1850348 RepID=A0A2A8CUN4_9BACT|nr:histidine kinase [Longibacter salinarum]PEN11464.1 ATPase [Longibacter salinarum]